MSQLMSPDEDFVDGQTYRQACPTPGCNKLVEFLVTPGLVSVTCPACETTIFTRTPEGKIRATSKHASRPKRVLVKAEPIADDIIGREVKLTDQEREKAQKLLAW